MLGSLRRTIAALTTGTDEQRQFELAAQRIQESLLEVTIPEIPGYAIGVHAEPARLVGGDYIDLYWHGDGALVFGLGDASGKSLAAALNSLMLRYLVRGLLRSLGTNRMSQVVTHMNEVLVEDIPHDAFITFLLGRLDLTSGLLVTVNAGHEPPLIFDARSQTVRTLEAHDIVLGVSTQTDYTEEEYAMGPGDAAVFYTDGLTEATNVDGEMYTIEGMKRELLRNHDADAGTLATTMFEAVKTYAGTPLRDDATICVLRRTNP
jgi:sigma-B regulation protein RsbU (phosphoserine phosphatase)